MTVQDLIDELQGFKPDTEVRLAFQPSWPFEHSLSEVAEVEPGGNVEIVRGDWGGEEGWYLLTETAPGAYTLTVHRNCWLTFTA